MGDAFRLAPAEWGRLRALLDEALALPAAQRPAWVDGLDDARVGPLHPRLRALLEHAAASDGPLDRWPGVETGDFAAPGEAAGLVVGPYRLRRELGSGGMASVWLAERDDMLQRRQVALKLPHGAWRRAGLAERMAREREILAGLEHPNIARLYDAGVGADGQPYLALEWVDGTRIDTFADAHGLDVAARVQLVVQVAHAVAYAHAQLVVHRDLKPANILVTADGQPKLLDFGIAKLLDEGGACDSALTQALGRALTPDYAAPEQLAGGAVGTAADQYALGVVLHELLTGRRLRMPGAPDSLEDPPSPSSVAPAERRRALRGDLDTIVGKALARVPSARYASVDAFAADLERHLAGLPVLARPDGAVYRLRKFVARHRAAVAGTVLLAVAVTGGAGAALWQAELARAEQRRAERALAFVTSVFRAADPWQSGADRPNAAQLLKSSRGRIETEFADDPLTRAELLTVLAEALVGLQDEAAAAEAGQAALAAAQAQAGDAHPLVLRARLAVFEAHFYRDDLPAARAELEAVLRVLDHDPQGHAALQVPARANLALLEIDEGKFADGERSAHDALARAARTPGAWVVREIELWRAIALARQQRGDAAGALVAAQRALALAERHYRDWPDHPDLTDTRSRRASALATAGRAAEALPAQREVVARVERAMGPDSRALGVHLHRLATIELQAGDPAAARASTQRALGMLRRHTAPGSPGIGAALATLAQAEFALGRPADARAHADEALALLAAAGVVDTPGIERLRRLRDVAASPVEGASTPAR